MTSQSIEFNKIKDDSTLPEIVRKSFRVPVEAKENVWAVINKKRYSAQDICPNGIGIILENNSAFAVEQTLLNCELNIFNLLIKNLNGKVVHLSPGSGEKWQCGIKWMDMEKGAADQISKIVFKMKEQLLQDNYILID
ncbi:MAG: PilZ domain-containing protein [Deltaproteobacteria bacterium]|nr:PilZ domain-containing protein [Deltaproteobacteria bacterium]